MTNPRLDAALSYLERGWSVIPINAANKRALVKWKHLTKRLPTEAEVRGWWKARPNAAVGVITGRISNLVVVDVDPRHGGDIDGWQKQQPADVRASTRGGGVHFYYSYPENGRVRNSASKIAQGVDVRGDRGYVLAPPSEGYHWSEGGNRLPQRAYDPPVSEQETPESGERWLEQTLRGVGYGERNDACARLAGYYVKKKLPADVIVQQLIAWNKLNDPPLAESEIRTTVESVARTAASSGVRADAARFQIVGDETGEGREPDAYEVTKFADYLSRYGSEPVSWLVKDWLPQQTVGMVVAPPESYKTWLLQDLAVSVATGLPFLGHFPVSHTGPVLFMQQEDWHGQIAHRFSLITARKAGIALPRMVGNQLHVHCPPRVPIYLHEHRRFRFDDEGVVAAWVEQIKRIRPILVILDPLYSAGSVADFMAGTAREMFIFKSIRDALGTTFLIAHHTRKTSRQENGDRHKTGDAEPEREDIWGSQFLNAWIETGWQLRRREELGTVSVVRHFKTQSGIARAILNFRIDTTQVPGKYEVDVREVKKNEKAEDTTDLVALLEKHGTMSQVRLVKLTGLDRSTIYRRMKNLETAGVVVKVGNDYRLGEQ